MSFKIYYQCLKKIYRLGSHIFEKKNNLKFSKLIN